MATDKQIEHARKMGLSNKGKRHRLGAKHIEETKLKISQSLTGRKLSEKHREALSKARRRVLARKKEEE